MKKIVIIGGGISGLALLHYLKQRRKGTDIILLEKNDYLGGTIQSIKKDDCLFETGPNGFLDSKGRTLELIKELNLDGSLVRAAEASKIRYISKDNTLHPLPASPKSFLSSNLLNSLEKIRVLGEFFIPKGKDDSETVYNFGKRRIGEKFAQNFLDPMVSGVFGGDARKTNLKAAFPRIHQMEQEHGSLFKAMIKIRKAKRLEGQTQDKSMGSPTGTLTTLRGGLAQIIAAIEERYSESIHLQSQVETVFSKEGCYEVFCLGNQHYSADELFLSVPAYHAAPMLKGIDEALHNELMRISYAPIAVVGFVFPSVYLRNKPAGYGYLIPSSEKKEVLGVLFESDIFPGRCRKDQVLLRIMIGGARNPGILSKTKEELIDLALNEIKPLVGENFGQEEVSMKDRLEEIFFTRWEKAIPQYDNVYCESLKIIEDRLVRTSNLHLTANYLKGVSLNDCIENAYQAAQMI